MSYPPERGGNDAIIDLIFSKSSLFGLSPRIESEVERIDDNPFHIIKRETKRPAQPSIGNVVNRDTKAAVIVTREVRTSDSASAPLAERASDPVSFPTFVFIRHNHIFTSTVNDKTAIISIDTDIS